MPQGRLTPPRGPMLDANGNVERPWMAFFQALADQVSAVEAAQEPAAPQTSPGQ